MKIIKSLILYLVLLYSNLGFSQDKNCNTYLEGYNISLNISPEELKDLYDVKEVGFLHGEYNRKDLYHYSFEDEIKIFDKDKTIKIDFAFKFNKLVYYKIEILNISYDEIKKFRHYLQEKTMMKKNSFIYSYKNSACSIKIWLINNKIKITKMFNAF